MPQSGVQLKLDRSGGVAVFCGEAEIGQGSDSVLAAMVAEVLGVVARRHPPLRGRHRPDAGRPRQLLLARHPDDGQRRAPGRRARARADRQGGRASSSRCPPSRLVFAERRVFDAEDPDNGLTFQEAVIAAEARFGTLGTTGSYIPPRSPGKLPRRRRRPLARLLLHGGGRRGRGRSRDRPVEPAPRLDRPRRRQVAQPGAGARPGRGQRLHGARRGDDGGAGLPPPAAAISPHALVHKFPSLLEYKSPTFLDMPPVTTYLIEDPDPQRPVRRQGGRPGAAAAGDAGGGQRDLRRGRRARRPGADPPAHGAQGAARPRRKGAEPRFGPRALPGGGLRRDAARADAGAGRRRPGDQRLPGEAALRHALGRRHDDRAAKRRCGRRRSPR